MSIKWPQSELNEIARQRAHYKAAIVCRRGHVLSSANSPKELVAESAQKCTTCGANNIKSCSECNTRIRGHYFAPLVISFAEFVPDNFCDFCGKAFPWASQQARIWELENVLDEQCLNENDRQQISFQLEMIASGKLQESDEINAWNKIKNAMGNAVNNERVKSLVFDLVGSYIKTQVFM